jgi:hypothetical protein
MPLSFCKHIHTKPRPTPLGNAKQTNKQNHLGYAVPRAQRILGFDFSYQPPPKPTVPCAASLQGARIALPGHGCGRALV